MRTPTDSHIWSVVAAPPCLVVTTEMDFPCLRTRTETPPRRSGRGLPNLFDKEPRHWQSAGEYNGRIYKLTRASHVAVAFQVIPRGRPLTVLDITARSSASRPSRDLLRAGPHGHPPSWSSVVYRQRHPRGGVPGPPSVHALDSPCTSVVTVSSICWSERPSRLWLVSLPRSDPSGGGLVSRYPGGGR